MTDTTKPIVPYIAVDVGEFHRFMEELAQLFETHPDKAGPIRDRLLELGAVESTVDNHHNWPHLVVRIRPKSEALSAIKLIMFSRKGWHRPEWSTFYPSREGLPVSTFAAKPLAVGDRCMLNSGGPVMTVIDGDAESVVAAWRNGETVDGSTFKRVTVRRVTP